jgi:hypothetical protein
MPNPNYSANGSIFPRNIQTNAKFQAASRACASTPRPSNTPTAAATTTPDA